LVNSKKSKIQNPKSKIGSWLLAWGVLFTGAGGAFAPWIWREAVALQLTGPGLAEFVKFLPEVRAAQIQIDRLYFLCPLFLAILALPLFAVNEELFLPGWMRWVMRLAVIPPALAALSPVWTPVVLIAPEFRLQTILAVVAIGLAVIAPLLKKIPLKILVVLWCAGGVAALALPWRQFSLIQTSMEEVYHESILPGWGWWLTVGGAAMSIAGGVWAAFFSQPYPTRNLARRE